MSPAAVRSSRMVVGAVIVAVLVLIAFGIFSSYRSAKDAELLGKGGSASSAKVVPSVSPDFATMTVPAKTPPKKVVVVLIEGLNLREQPLAVAKVIRGLSRGEQLHLLATGTGWYKVSDSKGSVGWVTANPLYDEVRASGQ